MSFSNLSADSNSLISHLSVDPTLTEVKALFVSLESPENNKILIETTPWERVTATPDELISLANEETDWSHDIIKQFFKSNPQYFEKKLDSITTLEELRKLLQLSRIIDLMNPELDISETMSKKNEIIKQKAGLFSSVSKEEFHPFMLKAKNLTVEEISEIGKAYGPGDRDRVSFFAVLLTAIKKINTVDELQIVLAPFSEEEKDLIVTTFTKISNPLQHSLSEIKKIGLIMGLEGRFYEGYHTTLANQLTKQRFADLAPEGSEPLSFHVVNDYQNAGEFLDPVTKHGDFQGIHASWEEHSFSFHLIQDGEKTHLIYVNRGKRHELAKDDDPAVHVFTFDDQETMRPLISGLMDALKTEKRNEISEYIHNSLMPHYNSQLSRELQKSNQKVGNCTVANANIAWHLALASQEMKNDSNCSFSQAYKNAKVAYKNMRMEDRAKAFCELMTDQKLKESGFQKNAVEQIMDKMTNKDLNGRETARFLINRLYEEDPDAVKMLLDDLSLSEYKIDKYSQFHWINACANKLKEEGCYDKIWAGVVVEADLFKKLTIEQLKINLQDDPSDINFIPKDTIAKLLKEPAIHSLSIANIQYFFDEAPLIRKDLISNLSVEQVTTLLENDDIDFSDLSDEQKENVDIAIVAYKENAECIKFFSDALVRKLLLSKEIDFNDLSDEQKENIESLEYKAVNYEAFYEALSTDSDFQVITQFNQSGDTSSLPMATKRICSYMSYDFAQAVTEGQFEDWQKEITAQDKAMMLRGNEGETGIKWQQLEQQTRSVPNTSPDVSLERKTLDVSERQVISEKIANCFRRQKSWQSCMDSPCIFLSTGNMQRENSLVQFGHGMMFTMATTKDGKLDPEHLLFMDPNLGVLKIKNNVETIDKLMSAVDEKLFSEFSVGSFRVHSISKEWLNGKKPIPHSYALSKAALIDQYLDVQIMKLEKAKGCNLWSFLWKKPDEKIDTLRNFKQELRNYLKTYLRENPETREDNLIKFQQLLLNKIDEFLVSEKKSKFGFTQKKPHQEFNALKENLDALEEHNTTCPTKYAKDFIQNVVKEYEEEEEEHLRFNSHEPKI